MASPYIVPESSIERRFCDFVKDAGFVAIKIMRKGWPDRLIQLSNGYGFYIEFKRKGKGAEKLQLHTHDKLRKKGNHVYVCDTLQQAKELFEYELAWSEYYIDEFVDFNQYTAVKDENIPS